MCLTVNILNFKALLIVPFVWMEMSATNYIH